MTAAAPEVPAAPQDRPAWLRWAWLLPFALAFAPTLVWLYDRWTVSIWHNGHGIFMPFIVAYLVHDHLRADPVRGEHSSPLGYGFVAAGLGLLAFDAAVRTEILSAIGLLVTLPGLSLLLLGTERTRHLVFPLLIAWLMLPLPAGFIAPLQLVLRHITAVAVEPLMPLAGIPVLREGTTMFLPSAIVEVADACSGFSTLYASVATGLILSHLVQSRRRKIALLALAVPAALVTNTIRVWMLSLMVEWWGVDLLETSAHEGSGVVAFGVVIATLFGVAGREVIDKRERSTDGTPLARRPGAPLAALCALALVPVGLHSYLRVERDDCANPRALVPGTGLHGAEAVAEREAWLDARVGKLHAWREGTIRTPEPQPDLSYWILRSHDAKQLYYRPHYRLVSSADPTPKVEWLDVDGESIPIHRAVYEPGIGQTSDATRPVVAYILAYRGEAVAEPYVAQLRAAPSLLFSGRQPMTLLMATAKVPGSQVPATERAALDWLARSWKTYRAVCD